MSGMRNEVVDENLKTLENEVIKLNLSLKQERAQNSNLKQEIELLKMELER